MTLTARLRIILNGVDPLPMRHIEAPLKIRLDRLHEVMQAAMGWTDTHLYEFRAGDAGWGIPDPDGFYDGPLPAKKTTLEKVLEGTGVRTVQYIYDFGDDWDRSIRVERVNDATPACSTRGFSRPPAPVRQRTPAALGATKSSSKPSPTPAASNTKT